MLPRRAAAAAAVRPPRRSFTAAARTSSSAPARSGNTSTGGAGGSNVPPGGNNAASGSSAAPPLSAALLSLYSRLPEIAEGLLATSASAADAAGQIPSAPRPAAAQSESDRQHRQRWEDELTELANCLQKLPNHDARTAAAVAELVSTHPTQTAALLKLLAAGLRDSAMVRAIWVRGGEGGDEHDDTFVYPAITVASLLIMRGMPLPASRHARGVQRFARALLATQPFHALARCLGEAAAAITAAASASSSGATSASTASAASSSPASSSSAASSSSTASSAAAISSSSTGASVAIIGALDAFGDLASAFKRAILWYEWHEQSSGGAVVRLTPPELAAEVAAEIAAVAADFARALAESGVVEHAARALLLLPARGAPLWRWVPHPAPRVMSLTAELWHMSQPPRGERSSPVDPSTAALLRSALGGRCFQTAVLVYGISTLRVVDRGPSYGLPVALQTAGLELITPGEGPCPDTTALGLMVSLLGSGTPLPPPGRGASLELALRAARAAAGSLLGGPIRMTSMGVPEPDWPATPLPVDTDTYQLLIDALECAWGLLPAVDTSPRQAEQRRDWWSLAGWAMYCMRGAVDLEWRLRLWELVTAPLVAVWPGGLLAPPEVAAALAGGLLKQLTNFVSPARMDPYTVRGLKTATATDLFDTCAKAHPSGPDSGFSLFLAPLLAYDNSEDAEDADYVLSVLGALAGLSESNVAEGNEDAVRHDRAEQAAARRQATALLRDLGRALKGRGGACVGRAAGAAAASAAAAGESPAQQLERMAAAASEMWELPLKAA